LISGKQIKILRTIKKKKDGTKLIAEVSTDLSERAEKLSGSGGSKGHYSTQANQKDLKIN